MKITDIKSFVIELAPTGENDYRYTTLGITQVFTDEGITGYGFRRTPDDVLNSQVRPGLIGKDPRNIIEILKSGALKGCATVENALWDISGKAANGSEAILVSDIANQKFYINNSRSNYFE